MCGRAFLIDNDLITVTTEKVLSKCCQNTRHHPKNRCKYSTFLLKSLFPLASLKHDINNFVYEIFRRFSLFFSLSKNQRLSDFVLPKCCRKQITLRRVVPAEWRLPRSCSGSYCGTLPQSLPACAVPEKCAH